MSGMVLTELEDVMQGWVQARLPVVPNGQTPWKAVWAKQNAPGSDRHVALFKWSIRKLGRDVEGPVNEVNGTRPRLGTRELRGQIRAYGKGAIQVLEDLRTLLDDEQHIDALQAGKLAVVNMSQDIVDLAALFATQFQEVGMLEIILRTHSYRVGPDAEVGASFIESVEIELETKDVAGNASSRDLVIPEPEPVP